MLFSSRSKLENLISIKSGGLFKIQDFVFESVYCITSERAVSPGKKRNKHSTYIS